MTGILCTPGGSQAGASRLGAYILRYVGRAVVELTVERPDGSLAFIANDGSGPSATARLQFVSPGACACPVGNGAGCG